MSLFTFALEQLLYQKAKSAVKTDSLGQFELVCNKKDVIVIKNKVFDSFSKRVTPEDNYITANLIFKDNDNNREAAVGMGYIEPDQLSYALLHLSHEGRWHCRLWNSGDQWSRNHKDQIKVDRLPSNADA